MTYYKFYFEHNRQLVEDGAFCTNDIQAKQYIRQIAEARDWVPLMFSQEEPV